ncbi:tRNA (adenosine(37)-N6)-dimethylallyltransferase MiaA [bacterium]|nr:tRNA (adenosine(37)-N6)-dimethylallyltransferase MiaA [bacterium]
MTLIVIVGPTASGKSSIAHKCALDFNGEIVGADSVQIYQNLVIGSAAPTAEEQSEVPYHLVGTHSLDDEINVATFITEAHAAIDDIIARGKVPIMVGGTHFWVDTFLDGLSPIPHFNEEEKEKVRTKYAEYPVEKLFEELQKIDPIWAENISSPQDRQRILRGLEVFLLTGKPLSHFHTLPREGGYDKPYLKIAVHRSRKAIIERIEKRTKIMISNGIIDEVKALRERGYTADNCRPLATIGYKETNDFLNGTIESREQLEELIAIHTRQLAKRQMIWLRKDEKSLWIQEQATLKKIVELFQNEK